MRRGCSFLRFFCFQYSVQQIRRAQSQLLRSASLAAGNSRLEAIRHELHLTSDILLLAAKIGRSLLGAKVILSNNNPGGGSSSAFDGQKNGGIQNLPPTL